jgi:hypothetical protein
LATCADCCKTDDKGRLIIDDRGCPPKRCGLDDLDDLGGFCGFCCFCVALFCDFILLYTILYIGMVDIQDLQNKEKSILNNLNVNNYKSLSIGQTIYYVIKEKTINDSTYRILYTDTDNDKLYSSENDSQPLQLFTDGKYPIIYISLLNKITNDNRGGKRIAPAAPTAPAYKLNGEKVSLLINKKKLHRSVYVKGNGKAKYCKINYEFVLLSKLKNKIL